MITIPLVAFYLICTFALGVGLILGGMFRVSSESKQ